MGFTVCRDSEYNNAIVSSILNPDNQILGMTIGSKIIQVHGDNVVGLKHTEILQKIQNYPFRPFFMVFEHVNYLYTYTRIHNIYISNIL